ncbi:hypothetical protein, partial [Xylella fastidiosa]|uniref:hypothetical protein n=1 Tax=Xylella fastidiosa TaxID=2371 RepID=UPI001F1AD534
KRKNRLWQGDGFFRNQRFSVKKSLQKEPKNKEPKKVTGETRDAIVVLSVSPCNRDKNELATKKPSCPAADEGRGTWQK